MPHCQLCPFTSDSLTEYTSHLQFHRNVPNFRFPCGISSCGRTFSKYSALKAHIYRDHKFQKDRHIRKSVDIVFGSLKCQVPLCGFECQELSDFLAHLRGHIKEGIEILCPFQKCAKPFNKKGSFTAHLSRNHRDWSSSCISKDICTTDQPDGENVAQDSSSKDDVTVESPPEVSDDEGLACSAVDSDQFLHSLALFYLKLQAKFLLPASTIQSIIDDFEAVHHIGQLHLLGKFREKLSLLNISDADSKHLVEEMSKADLLHASNSVLRSDQTRKSFFKTHFNFVEPVQIYLGQDEADRDRFLQYIPIKDTLKALYKQESVRQQYYQTRSIVHKEDIFLDISDGQSFQSNALFSETPSALRLILYQDSFEVVNPLGSGKKKHKVLAVYLSLADLLPHNRSSTDHMQLVLLCREKDFKSFGQKTVFKQLIEDLQHLEVNGTDIGGSAVMKGTICAITGDNLGSHTIGGFTENFSTTQHFCRYCLQDRASFESTPHLTGPRRSVENYEAAVKATSDNPESPSFGVKFASVFNDLQYFHVCQPGLPPCLGHDLFEGVVSCDLALYVAHFVKTDKFFTYVHLNRSLCKFRYLGSDADNKPSEVNVSGEKLGGHAVQNWCFLRLLPLIIGERIRDPLDNGIWELCLKLRQIVEIICAPKVDIDQIAELRDLIEEYVQERKALFPSHKLKPKHHFLVHYPELILQFGPLIRLWTLRFESKHTYFKECARKLHNFKNLCSTLATRHQLLQAYLASGFLFPNSVNVERIIDFDLEDYHRGIQEAAKSCDLGSGVHAASTITYKGTTYKKGLLVILHSHEQGFVFGKIKLVLINKNQEIFFITENYPSVYLVELGVYCLENQCAENRIFSCIPADSLLDYYPLPEYKIRGMSLVSLHHAPCTQ